MNEIDQQKNEERSCVRCPLRIVAGLVERSEAGSLKFNLAGLTEKQQKVVARVLRACADNTQCEGVRYDAFYEGAEADRDGLIVEVACGSQGQDIFATHEGPLQDTAIFLRGIKPEEIHAMSHAEYLEQVHAAFERDVAASGD